MDKKTGTPISEMDDNALQIHALSVAYREAERRREEAEKKAEQMKGEAADLEAQIREMAEAYQAVMAKNTELNAACRKQQKEIDSLRQELAEARRVQKVAERGQDA